MGKSRNSLVFATLMIPLAFLLGACGNSPTPIASHSATPSQSPSATASLPETKALAQYWVADTARGFRLYREFSQLPVTPDPISTSLTALFTQTPKDSDYASLWPKDTKVNSVLVSGALATVDLSFSKLNVGSEGESVAIAQLVWTATAADPSVKRVRITVDGNAVESLAGHVDATKPFTRGPAAEVLAPVWIISPEEGAQLPAVDFTLKGMASTFEANVAWKVFKDGKLVQQGSTLSAGAAPSWKPWSVKLTGLAPGDYTFIAMEYSARDGSLVAQDTKNAHLT